MSAKDKGGNAHNKSAEKIGQHIYNTFIKKLAKELRLLKKKDIKTNTIEMISIQLLAGQAAFSNIVTEIERQAKTLGNKIQIDEFLDSIKKGFSMCVTEREKTYANRR